MYCIISPLSLRQILKNYSSSKNWRDVNHSFQITMETGNHRTFSYYLLLDRNCKKICNLWKTHFEYFQVGGCASL